MGKRITTRGAMRQPAFKPEKKIPQNKGQNGIFTVESAHTFRFHP
jgi:hypothetical protein